MHLEKLSLLNFKNYSAIDITFNSRINLFVGRNGSGKTNLLDSIYYLSFTKSAFSSADAQCIRNGENLFVVRGIFNKEEKRFEVVSSLQAGMKKIFRENQQDYEKISDHIGRFPAVLIAPDDTDLIKEGSELRRKFFDGIIAQIDRQYLEYLIQYNQVLKQRNALLKIFYDSGKQDLLALEAYDHQLCRYGNYIFQKRSEFVIEFVPVFERFFSMIVEAEEKPSLRYESGLNEITFEDGLKQSRQKDQFLQRTSFGIHRDDFGFFLNNNEIKRTGSQGQHKSFVIALKLAQYEIIEKHKGFKPILLLDDIFDKLDDFRIAALIGLIKTRLGQIFITDARPQRTSELLDQIGVSASKFLVDGGVIASA
jgi:DNA replication and repair protein RecF